MNKNYYITSDHHFGHARIIDHCNRPFHDVEMMDDYMVMRWNEVVKPNDIVYHLGDLFWSEKSARDILPFLNGEIHLILGNHDKNWKIGRNKKEKSPFTPSSNLIVEDGDIVTIKEPIHIVLCHYPLMSWNGAFHGVFHMHGHTHNNSCLSEGRRINVCVENTDYTPVNLNIFKGCKNIEEVRLYNKDIVI